MFVFSLKGAPLLPEMGVWCQEQHHSTTHAQKHNLHYHLHHFLQLSFLFLWMSQVSVRPWKSKNVYFFNLKKMCFLFCRNCEQIHGETWVGNYLTRSNVGSGAGTAVMVQDAKEFYYAFYLSFYWTLSTSFGIGYTTDELVLVQKKETTLLTVHLVFSFALLTYFFASVGAAISGQVENV